MSWARLVWKICPLRSSKLSLNYNKIATDLSEQLLYEIHPLTCSPALPLTCKRLYHVFKSAPASVTAQYIIASLYEQTQEPRRSRRTWTRIFRFPICTEKVFDAIVRHPATAAALNRAPVRPVLPRHLFRSLTPKPDGSQPWTDRDQPLPFLKYLYDPRRYTATSLFQPPDINADDGYSLTRAVHAKFIPLVRFLLDQAGASPHHHNELAVRVAIRRKDLALVRMLIEPSESATATSSGKRMKLMDRVEVNSEMLRLAVKCGARDVAEYLLREKKCKPDIETLQLIVQ
jgi:hypothetical protein